MPGTRTQYALIIPDRQETIANSLSPEETELCNNGSTRQDRTPAFDLKNRSFVVHQELK